MTVAVEHGDCRELIRSVAESSIDACVTDPPYSLVSIVKRFGKPGSAPAKDKDGLYKRASAGFMGKQWDTGETAFDPEFWSEVIRVLKPGAHLIAFSGTRTFHRMACAIEDAGFEIRDQIGWIYGSGFPKSHNIGNGWGTAIKPAWEPICLARKPLIGTVAANVLEHGTGALNIDGCRIGTDARTYRLSGTPGANSQRLHGGDGRDAENARRYAAESKSKPPVSVEGRWPANVIHDGSEEVLEAFAAYGESSGKGGNSSGVSALGQGSGWNKHNNRTTEISRTNDHGTAARFFYSAKADAEDRLGSKHPTVKPVDLMAYLCRLVTPPGGLVLDPFAGSGTTGMACLREGFRCILFEREAEYIADINRRLAHVRGADTPLFGGSAA